jgi:DNA-binding beta-propeller fold protein YncE
VKTPHAEFAPALRASLLTSATRRLRPSWALHALVIALLVITVAPALAGWRLISNYAAIPRVVAQPVRDVALHRPQDHQSLSGAQGIVVDTDGAIYLAEQYHRRLVAFPNGTSQNGKILATHVGGDALRAPSGLAIGPDRNLYLLDSGTGIVHVFTRSGEPVRSLILAAPGARAIALDSAGNIYVGDVGTASVRKYLPDGEVDKNWGDERWPGFRPVGQVAGLAAIDGHVFATILGKLIRIDEQGQIVFARDLIGNAGPLTVGPNETLLMSDDWTRQIWLLNTSGDTIGRVIGPGDSMRTFVPPGGIAVSADGGHLYVVHENRVAVYEVAWNRPA